MEEFLQRGDDCPKLAIATHFHEVFRNGVLPSHLPFTPKHMHIVLEEGDASDDIVFLFKAVPGFADDSYAGHCARLYGVSEDLVQRGLYVTNLLRAGRAAQLAFEGLEDDEFDEGESTTRPPRARCAVDKNELLQLEDMVRDFIEWDLPAELDVIQEAESGTDRIRATLRSILTLEKGLDEITEG
jgi:DNA mismatch repair protein MSH5